jgi:aspyridone synthetase trans-acting enoyl reductase
VNFERNILRSNMATKQATGRPQSPSLQEKQHQQQSQGPRTIQKPPRKLPSSHTALVATGPVTLAPKRVPLPVLKSNQVLIKTHSVALNPSDHKLLSQSTTIGAISGSDFAGTVVKLGGSEEECAGLKIGDKVFGVVFGANPGNPKNGAFAGYLAATAPLCLRVPDGMRLEKACSLGMGIMTVGLVFRALGLRMELDPALKPTNTESNGYYYQNSAKGQGEHVLVHGGATATGTLAIQILRLAGYQPIATCSASNFDLVKSRGAIAAFDYNDPFAKDAIKRYTSNNLSYVLDCIGNASTMTLCYSALSDKGGSYVALEQYPRRLTIRRRNVKHDWVLGWSLFGEEVKLAGAYARDANPEDLRFGGEWMAKVQPLLDSGVIECHPLEVMRGGLGAVTMGLDNLREGRVRGKKVVIVL